MKALIPTALPGKPMRFTGLLYHTAPASAHCCSCVCELFLRPGAKIIRRTVDGTANYTDAFMLQRARRYDVKGKKYISTPAKYYFCDVGLRNARIDFRQIEPTHIMENVIYNELVARGYQVDVGVVEVNEKNKAGNGIKRQLEVDFVANKGYDRYYIQSAYGFADESKKEQEKASLRNISDSFERIIVTGDDTLPYRDENGYRIENLLHFLLHGI